ncbi:hypothetical protein [Microbacterium sp. 69-10]|uniref:hypothetical protein n=1 Tax=Microbacterium sp. 69-10 TaxID=1895783 RepID=UPI0025D5546F|nr:hypothetical protein [Microbacterium sp. 69-10]
MTTTVQQIVYARHPERWHALAEVLGFVAPYPPEADWAEFDGGGVLAVHREIDGHADGTVDLHLLVDDLDAAQQALAGRDVTRTALEGVGDMLLVRFASGLGISVSAGARATAGSIAVQPILFQEDVAEARGVLEALGLRPDIVADRGGWAELHAAGGGSVGVHEASEPAVGLGFLADGDLDALAARLRDAGFEASVVDEAYARTVRVAEPDVWINGVQTDLYGYHREG